MRKFLLPAMLCIGILLASSSLAVAYADENPSLISVTGTASVSATPDEAYVSVVVDNKNADPSVAISSNNKSMSALYDALSEFDIAKKDIQTTAFVFEKVYRNEKEPDASGNVKRVFDGYKVTNSIRVTVCDFSNAPFGKLITKLAEDGATTISDISFGSKKAAAKLDEARAAAMRDALNKAHLYAEAGEFKLGHLKNVSEQLYQPRGMMYESMSAKSASADVTPVSGGSLNYTISVNATWNIAPNYTFRNPRDRFGNPIRQPDITLEGEEKAKNPKPLLGTDPNLSTDKVPHAPEGPSGQGFPLPAEPSDK